MTYRISTFFILATSFFIFSGCDATYKANTLEQSLKEILRKEYDINQVEVKVVGKTLGVYLPLEKLFSANLEAFSKSSPEDGINNLFEFNVEAMEKVEDVLFSTSRIVLSTDQDINFYVLKAVETQSTGIEFVLTGYVMDMKRVRYWDISLSEYRKRLLHDLSVNRTIVWKRTITDLFDSMGKTTTIDLFKTYFAKDVTIKDIAPFFFRQVTEAKYKDNLEYELLDIRTKPINEREVLVYVKQKETFVPKEEYETQNLIFENEMEHEYLFVLQAEKMSYKIRKVFPFYFIEKGTNTLKAIEFPDELKIYDNIGSWVEEFELEEVSMGDFLARQITKRLQTLVAESDILSNSFSVRKVACEYTDYRSDSEELINEPSFFSVEYDLGAQSYLSISLYPEKEKNEKDEIMRELIALVLTEFNDVMYGYKFKDYSYLELVNNTSGENLIIPPHELELFKVKKLSIDSLLSP